MSSGSSVNLDDEDHKDDSRTCFISSFNSCSQLRDPHPILAEGEERWREKSCNIFDNLQKIENPMIMIMRSCKKSPDIYCLI